MENILEVKKIYKFYENFNLINVSFALPRGTIMGFIGENGAGKSTTIKMILDMIKIDEGQISIFGESSVGLKTELKEKIGVVLDDSDFFKFLNIKSVNSILKNTYKTWNSDKFFEYAERFSLPLKQKIKDFSKGMKMKLMIATALSHDSELLILDEPTSGLDPIVRNEILDILSEFIQNENCSVLISSHILSDLEKICDYIAFVSRGELVMCEEKDVLLQKYSVIKCDKAKLSELNDDAIIGVREHNFGCEALVVSEEIPADFEREKTTIEDIMLYFTKGAKS